jgi:hypothetical protein
MYKTVLLLITVSACQRDGELSTVKELETITGDKMTCFQIYDDAGFLCKSTSGHNYYCPRNNQKDCFFTLRIQLQDIQAEKSK